MSGLDNYEVYIPHRDIGLVYSPHDNGHYWEECFGDWLTSKVFATKEEAMAADEEDMEWGC